MQRYRLQSSIQNTCPKRALDRTWFRQWGLTIILGTSVACGFVYVSWQHVKAVEIGYETEHLKQQIQQLDQDQRKLELERQRLLSPSVLENRARRQGMGLPQASQTIVIEQR